MIDKQNNYFLRIIRSALTGESLELPDDFNLKAAADAAKKHRIFGMFYYGAINCGVSAESEEMQHIFNEVCMCAVVTEQQKHLISVMTSAFEENGVDYMLLKGSNLRYMYPKPEMRIMGDIDILIRTEQYPKIRTVMLGLGFTEGHESDHEFIWRRQNRLVELHKRLIPSYNKDYYAYYGDGWRLAVRSDNSKHGYILSPEDEMIYIFTHFAKHYRDAGVGIRHFADLWVFRNAHTELNEQYIAKELKKLSLYEFYQNIISALDVCFKGAEPTEKTDFIIDVILKSGVYGSKKSHLLSDAVKRSKSGGVKKAKYQKILLMIFTPIGPLSDLYPVLKRFPVLLPFAWVYHWFDVLFRRRSNISKRNSERKMITEDNIADYQDALKFVGLDFNFKDLEEKSTL